MTGKQIIAKVKLLHKSQEPLNITAVRRNHPGLLAAAFQIRPFLGWKQALEKAGIAYKNIEIELLNYCECLICGKVAGQIATHLSQVHQISGEEYQQEHPNADILSEQTRAKSMSSRIKKPPIEPHWEPLWSPEYCLDRLYHFYCKGMAINRDALINLEYSLTANTWRHFGEWDNAIEALGLDPLEQCLWTPKRFWSREELLTRLKARKQEGKPMNSSAVAKDDQRLIGNSKKYFGTYDNALVAAGMNPDEERTIIATTEEDRDALLEALRQTARETGRARLEAAQQTRDSKKNRAVVGRFFRTWRNAAKAAGVGFMETSVLARYPRAEDVIEEIRERHREGKVLTSNAVSKEDLPLVRSAVKHFGTLARAVKAAELV